MHKEKEKPVIRQMAFTGSLFILLVVSVVFFLLGIPLLRQFAFLALGLDCFLVLVMFVERLLRRMETDTDTATYVIRRAAKAAGHTEWDMTAIRRRILFSGLPDKSRLAAMILLDEYTVREIVMADKAEEAAMNEYAFEMTVYGEKSVPEELLDYTERLEECERLMTDMATTSVTAESWPELEERISSQPWLSKAEKNKALAQLAPKEALEAPDTETKEDAEPKAHDNTVMLDVLAVKDGRSQLPGREAAKNIAVFSASALILSALMYLFDTSHIDFMRVIFWIGIGSTFLSLAFLLFGYQLSVLFTPHDPESRRLGEIIRRLANENDNFSMNENVLARRLALDTILTPDEKALVQNVLEEYPVTRFVWDMYKPIGF